MSSRGTRKIWNREMGSCNSERGRLEGNDSVEIAWHEAGGYFGKSFLNYLLSRLFGLEVWDL